MEEPLVQHITRFRPEEDGPRARRLLRIEKHLAHPRLNNADEETLAQRVKSGELNLAHALDQLGARVWMGRN